MPPGSGLWSLEEAKWGGAPGSRHHLLLVSCAAAAIGTCRKGGRPDAGLNLPVRQGRRVGAAETRRARGSAAAHAEPGETETGYESWASVASARVSSRASSLPAPRVISILQPSRPRPCALRPSPRGPTPVAKDSPRRPKSNLVSLIGPQVARCGRTRRDFGRRGLPACRHGGRGFPPCLRTARQSVTARDAGEWSSRPSSCLYY